LANVHCAVVKVPLLFAVSRLLRGVKTTCVDIGCGVVPTPLVLEDVCSKVYAYDVDPEVLWVYGELSRSHHGVEIIERDVEEVEVFGDGRVGLVIALSILEHLRRPLRVLVALRRSMASRGLLVAAVPWPTPACRRAAYEDSTHRLKARRERRLQVPTLRE